MLWKDNLDFLGLLRDSEKHCYEKLAQIIWKVSLDLKKYLLWKLNTVSDQLWYVKLAQFLRFSIKSQDPEQAYVLSPLSSISWDFE